MGKAPAGIAKIAGKHQIPVLVLAGDISEGNSSLHDSGITAYFTIVSGPVDLEVAMNPGVTRSNLRRMANQIGRVLNTIKIGCKVESLM